MQITFYGAAGEVTGSNSLIEIGGFKILIDCGMFQGDPGVEVHNVDPLPYDASTITHVLVTHAHLDHVGRLPLLFKNGYKGHFFATKPTVELAKLIMEDAQSIMEYNHKKFGRPILYGPEDIAGVMEQFKGVEYGVSVILNGASQRNEESLSYSTMDRGPSATSAEAQDDNAGKTVKVIFHDVGHIFGSAFIEIEAAGKRVVFSGDVGNVHVPILRDTEDLPKNIDVLVSESTYGDRLHTSLEERQQLVERMVAEAIDRGGVLMIPSFSLERTQELIYELNDLIDRKHRLKRVPIFLDSPLAIDALKVYRKYPQYYDEEAAKLFQAGDDLFTFPGLTATYTRDDSMKINNTPGAKIIIAGAGMMNGGRILHHALRYLSDARNTLLLIGYQSPGTLGQQIHSGMSPVTVLGEEVSVRCQVKMVGALSAHGDQNKLLEWIGAGQPKQVYLNHGDPPAKIALAKKLAELGIRATPVAPGMKVVI